VKLTDNQAIFIKLLLKSPDRGDGWRSVSTVMWKHTKEKAAETPDLLELDDDGMRVRLTDKGQVIAEYLA
jgi:hypothetical protein